MICYSRLAIFFQILRSVLSYLCLCGNYMLVILCSSNGRAYKNLGTISAKTVELWKVCAVITVPVRKQFHENAEIIPF